MTRLGEITFDVPQVREGGFYPSALEKGSRTEQALHLALAEMYVQGVSTRKVIEVLQRLVGPTVSISSTQVSRAAETLDVGLQAWRERPLGETPYVFLDARYERIRRQPRKPAIWGCILSGHGIQTGSYSLHLGYFIRKSPGEESYDYGERTRCAVLSAAGTVHPLAPKTAR